MNIISGSQYRNFAAQNEFNFVFSAANSTTSGISNLGFSGATGESLNIFKFESGKIFDLNNRYVWGYNPREIIDISGNIGSGYINYFINNTPVCLYAPRGTGYYDNFYINTQNSTVDFDFIINGTLPNYSFEYDANLEVLETITGYIKNTSSPIERSFKIFSGQVFNTNFEYSLLSFNSGLISGGSSGQFLLKPVNVSANDVTPGNLTLLFYTNFGAITQDISFNVYPSPIYFTDFVTGYTGLLGLADDFTLEKLYNFELDSIYPTNRNVSFILQNVSGHTGQKIYAEFDASGYVSGLLSGFIYGFDYITGNISGTGISISEKDFYGKYPTGIFKISSTIEQYATGDIIYNYNLPIYGGFGTGTTPVGTFILGSGFTTGIELFSGFRYGANNLYNNKNISLTGFYNNKDINIKTGNLLVYTPASFTGSFDIDYNNFLWSCGFVTGTGYFSGESFSGYSNKIIGITGARTLDIDNSGSGVLYFNTTIFKNQDSAEVLIPLIGQNNGLFLNSGSIYYYEGSSNTSYQILNQDNIVKNSITGTGYAYFTGGYQYYGFIFSFNGYENKDKGNIQYFSFDLDKNNALYRVKQPINLYLSTGESPTGEYILNPLSANLTNLDTGKLYDSDTYLFKCTQPNNNLNINNTYKHIKLEITGKQIFEHQSSGNLNLITGVGIKNFQLYRSIPVRQLSGLTQIQYPINTNNMTGYSTPSGNILNSKSFSGTVIASQDTIDYPAWYAFNSDKNLYPYSEVLENFDGETTLGYGLNNPLYKIFSGFSVEFQNTGLVNYLGVEISEDGITYYECYNKTSGIQLNETGSFGVGTGYKYFRLNFTPLPSCVYSPYSDACYQKVIKDYPNCCNTLWDNSCEIAYRGCTGAFPPGIDPPVYVIPNLYPLQGILDAGFTNGNPISMLINGSGRPQIWGGSTEQFNNITGLVVSNIPNNATGLKSIYTPFPDSTVSGVVFGIGCSGNLVMWGATGSGNIGTIPNNLGPIKKIVFNGYGGALILKENNTIVAPKFEYSVPCCLNRNPWTGIVNILNSNNIIDIDAGENHYLALLSDGSICAWGLETHINDMNGTDLAWAGFSETKGQYLIAKSGFSNIKAIAAGYEFSLLISGYTNTLTGWGIGPINSGNYPYTYPYTGIKIPNLTNVKSITAGIFNGMAIYGNNGNITGWGVGTGIANSQNYGQNVFAWTPTTGIYSIAAGGYHCLALRKTGVDYEIIRWGEGSGIARVNAATGLFNIKPILTGYISGNKYC